MTDTTLDLPKILADHAAWLRGEPNGERANLMGADLRGADLSRADLSKASLYGADLSRADLRGATGIISAGHPNGWLAYGWLCDGRLSVRVGCREFRLAEGRAYWAGKADRREVMASLDYIEAVAKIRGWRIEE